MQEQLCTRAIRLVTEMVPSSKNAAKMVVARRLVPHARIVACQHLKLKAEEDLAYELHRIEDFLSE